MEKNKILATEFSEAFVQGMKDRMIMSFFKYGPIADAYPHKVSSLESLQKRIDKYMETGNTEFLIDVANFAMIEFMRPAHPNAHFRSTDSGESPGRAAYDTSFEPTQKSNRELTDEEWRQLREQRER
jgi:hypothetical protein